MAPENQILTKKNMSITDLKIPLKNIKRTLDIDTPKSHNRKNRNRMFLGLKLSKKQEGEIESER